MMNVFKLVYFGVLRQKKKKKLLLLLLLLLSSLTVISPQSTWIYWMNVLDVMEKYKNNRKTIPLLDPPDLYF